MLPNRVDWVGLAIVLSIAIVAVIEAFDSAFIREEFFLINY